MMALGFEQFTGGIEFFEGLERGTITPENYVDSSEAIEARCRGAEAKKRDEKRSWSILKMDENRLNHRCGLGNNPCSGDDVDYLYDYKVVYQKLAVYFKVIGKAKAPYVCVGTNPLWPLEAKKDIHIKASIRFSVRCRREVLADFDQNYYTRVMEWTPYDGSRGLSKYDFNVAFTTKHTWDAAPNHTILLQIMDGY